MAIHDTSLVSAPRNCVVCGTPLTREQLSRHRNRSNPPRFCSKPCQHRALKGVKPEAALAAPKTPYRKHGHNNGKHSPTYTSWHSMRQRCNNPNHRNFDRYGGRGIKVCERWSDFRNFLADMGERPEGRSLDRIDSEGHYEPANCRWATQKEQCNNFRDSYQFRVTYKGEIYTLQELADKFGIDRYTLRRRITTAGWPEEMWHLPPDRRLRAPQGS